MMSPWWGASLMVNSGSYPGGQVNLVLWPGLGSGGDERPLLPSGKGSFGLLLKLHSPAYDIGLVTAPS